MRTQKQVLAPALLALVLLYSGCSDNKSGDVSDPELAIVKISSMTLTPTTASIAVGATVKITGTALDRKRRPVVNPRFVWSSASPGIASVDSTGLVTGVSAGTVSVTAAYYSTHASVRITVTPVVTPPPPPTGPSDVAFAVDASSTFPISRYIYGANFLNESDKWSGAAFPAAFTFNRFGGNRLSAYNWETNYSNAGSDYNFQNDQYLSSSTTPGQGMADRANASFAAGEAFLFTVPMIGYVAGDACNCNVGSGAAALTHMKRSIAAKGSAFTLTPDVGDGMVYQDEFANWVGATFPGRTTHPTAPVFVSLDNEPDIWSSSHSEIITGLQTYAGFSDTTVVYAKAIKNALPNALVFGPATATYTGITLLGRYPTPDPVYGTQNFVDVYLDRLKAAEATAGKRLVDVLDVHFYSEAGAGNYTVGNDYATQDDSTIQARVQSTRSLWDPTYTDNSWVAQVTGGPIRLIPRLKEQIAAHYPGTKLSISEYYYGRAGDISGGIAQADVLGIFGREGVFAASLWPNAGVWALPYNGDGNKAYAFAFGAFRMFRNYDGAGSTFGDLGLKATTTNVQASSVYASRDAAGNVVLVAINKTNAPKIAGISLANAAGLTKGRVYLLSAASAVPVRQADIAVTGGAALYTMPALSVTTIVITP